MSYLIGVDYNDYACCRRGACVTIWTAETPNQSMGSKFQVQYEQPDKYSLSF